nr:hypothetical protein pmam_244 [Pithovirus mammoth]
MLPSNSFPPQDLFTDEELYDRRKEVLTRLVSDPEEFALNGYQATILGYVTVSPFDFSTDRVTELPSQEQRASRDLCLATSTAGRPVVPLIEYLPFSYTANTETRLCHCETSETQSQLICDPFTSEVLVAFVVDFSVRNSSVFPSGVSTYQQILAAYFCSGKGHLLERPTESTFSSLLPTLDEQTLKSAILQVLTTLDFLWQACRFVSPLTFEDIRINSQPVSYTYGSTSISSPLTFQIGNFSQSRCSVQTRFGHCILFSRRLLPFPSVSLDSLESTTVYSSNLELTRPVPVYFFLCSLFANSSTRQILLASSWGQKMWEKLWVKEQLNQASQIFLSTEMFVPDQLEGFQMKCSILSSLLSEEEK